MSAAAILRRLGLCALSWACTPARADAYSYASPLAPGCHEGITLTALRRVRERLPTAGPLPTSAADRAWIEDLPLELPGDARDAGSAALISGVRDNDLKGRSGLDTSELAFVHGDPNAQREHCLRKPEHDEPDGTEQALFECRRYVRERFELALHGLDDRGWPDGGERVDVKVHLAFAGTRSVSMPQSHVELGRALHALQDSFSHAVRSEDGLRVRTLLNWTDYVHGHHDEDRDGPAHRAALDRCEGLDPVRQVRLERAIEASTALLMAALDPELDRHGKLAAADAALDRYLAYEPGCEPGNEFCDAEELAYPPEDLGCHAVPGRTHPAGALVWPLAALVSLVLRRRIRGRSGSLQSQAVWLWLALAGAWPSAAGAQAPAASSVAPTATLTREPVRSMAGHFVLSSSFSGAVDEAAIAAAVATHYRVSERVLLGLGAEWNPWASLELRRLRPGTFNAYASAVFRPYVTRALALRVTANAGAALLLFDLYGAPSGSLGPYVGLSLLGLELPLSSHVRLVLDPAHVVVAAPQLRGIPLTHRQYRATVTLELLI